MNMFDVAMVGLTIGAGAWGYWNGGLKMAVKLAFIAGPSFALAYFGSDIASIGTTISAMLKDRISLPLGLVGAGSGLLGMVGIVGSLFFGSRIILSIMDLHAPGKSDRAVGSAIGVTGVLLMVLPLFVFVLKTFPHTSSNALQGSYIWPYVRPAIVATYRPIDGFIDRRMAGLVNGLSDNNFIARLALSKSGQTGGAFEGLMAKVKNIDVKEVMRLQKAARALDPKQVEKLLAAYKSGDMSRERLKSHLENPNFKTLD